MTLSEIKSEIARDYPIVRRKAEYTGVKMKHIFHPHGKESKIQLLDYVSKNKNNWIIRIEVNKKELKMSFLVYFYNEIGILGIIPSDDDAFIHVHTSHFFKRFNERLHLNLRTPVEILHKYLDESDSYKSKITAELAPGIFKTFTLHSLGYCLGIMDNNIKVEKLNTFITHEMLGKNQISISEYIKKETENNEDPDYGWTI